MKKLILISLLALFSQSIFSQIPNYVPANGLVGWWPFNGNANDESGNGNNGTVNGAILSDDRTQNPNSCFNFNVNNWSWGAGGDEIYIPYNGSFNSPFISVSVWFMKTSNGTQNQGLTIINRYEYGYSNPNGQTWGAGLDNGVNTPIITSVIEGSTQNNQQAISVIGDQIELDIWYNVVFTFDGQLLKQYINGVFISSNNLTGFTLNTNGNSGISIGVSDQANGHWSPFGGKIDDIGIWSRALTACEIQNLYTSQLNATFVSAGADQTICNGQQVSLSGSNSQNYAWNNGVIDSIPFFPTTTQDYIVNADSASCQSSDTVTVFVNEPTSSTQSQTALDSYTWPLNNQTYTQSGTHTATIPNAAGCDSLVTLNLTLNFTGIFENSEAQISIAPNPASSKINVKSDVALLGSKFIIYDALGKEVKSGKITSIDTEVDLSNLNNGVYLFKIGERQIGTFKIIKE